MELFKNTSSVMPKLAICVLNCGASCWKKELNNLETSTMNIIVQSLRYVDELYSYKIDNIFLFLCRYFLLLYCFTVVCYLAVNTGI